MKFEFDADKDATNETRHGVSLSRAPELFTGDDPLILPAKTVSGEPRFRVYGVLDDRPYLLVFAMRGERVRAISLRRTTWRELNRYATVL